jgi:hypothetical protein
VLAPIYSVYSKFQQATSFYLNDAICPLFMQANAMVEMASGTGNLPHQYEAVQEAASFTAPGHDEMQFQEVAMLIMNMLTEDVSERWTAQDVCEHEWLTEAVAAPFVGCPMAM